MCRQRLGEGLGEGLDEGLDDGLDEGLDDGLLREGLHHARSRRREGHAIAEAHGQEQAQIAVALVEEVEPLDSQ